MRTAILWYRRDLRVHDHPALHHAAAEFERLVAVFVLDDALLHGRFRSASRTRFLLGCLRALDDELRERGSALVVRHGSPERELVSLAAQTRAQTVLWTSDVAPYARARDARVSGALREAGVEARPWGGTYAADVSQPRTREGRPYSVFSPFWRAWRELPRRDVLRAPRGLPPLPSEVRSGRLPGGPGDLGLADAGLVPEPLVEPGEAAARAALARWLDGGLGRYAERQDGMARKGTSGLSPYLRWGCLSPRELEERASGRGGKGAGAWVRQLCWREFYAHVLLMWPSNAGVELQERYRDLEWADDDEALGAWQRGETGYPLVDAGMRQLAATGWMHNRARLAVGLFPTKDLHLDWRHGERGSSACSSTGSPRRTTATGSGSPRWAPIPPPTSGGCTTPRCRAGASTPAGSTCAAGCPSCAMWPTSICSSPGR